ncbi:MAG: TolC family protein, partial [Cyanobacteria bacterium J06555_12]
LQEILDEADAIRKAEDAADVTSEDETDEAAEAEDTETDAVGTDTGDEIPLFGPGTSTQEDEAPPILVPEDPQDIVTPDAAPSLEVPDDAPPVDPIPAVETLTLPQEPLEVRVEAIQGFSLEEALEVAIEQNPDILNAQLEVDIATKGITAARAEYFPQLSTAVNYSFSDPAVPDGTVSGFGGGADGSNIQNIISGELRFSFTVIDGGGRTARNLVADQGLLIAEYNLEQIIQDVRLNVAEAYYSLQLSDTQVLVAEADVLDSESSLSDASARERAGIGTRFEVLQAESRLANDRQALIAARNDQRVSRFQLAQLLSFDESVEAAATDPIEPSEAWPLSLEETLVQAFQNRAEFESIIENVEQERQNAQAALSSIRPNISIFSTLDYQAQLDDTFSQEAFIARGFSVGAAFTWTAFDGGAALANAQQADLRRQQQRNAFASTRDAVRFEVENAFFSLNSFREQIDAAKVGLESAQESLRLARLRFEAGVGTQTDVLSAQSELSDARQNLAAAVSNYNIAIVQLKRAVNNL